MPRWAWSAATLAQELSATEHDGYWTARCPAHDDTHDSLSIRAAADGHPLLKCHAGCDWKAVNDAIRERWPAAFKANGRKRGAGKIVATYDYRNAAGELIGQVCRLEPKSFRQRRPDGNGGWSWKMEGLQLPLYRLPEIAPCQAVYVVEGEKDADALWALGLPATSSPGGAGKWRGQHSDTLRGKRVCIIADKDKPGRAHAQAVARGCYLAGAETVRMVECPDPHKDISDWIEAGAIRERIIALARDAGPWTPGGGASPTVETEASAGDFPSPPPTSSGNWQAGWITNDNGDPRPLLANAMHALRHAPQLAGCVSLDTFKDRIVIQKETPWGTAPGSQWRDHDTRELTEWLQQQGLRVGTLVAADAAEAVGCEGASDSLQDYLGRLSWDQRPRLGGLATLLGAADDLSAILFRKFLIAAVARALNPGCQVDSAIVLEGPQGQGKSRALRALFDPHGQDWFRDELPPVGSKDAAQQLLGAWCIEVAELEAWTARRAEMEAVKAFISRRVDSYRPSYGRNVVDRPRRCVFAGSTNEQLYLRDHTGNRRFWPIACTSIRVDAIERDRDQLWAEAVQAYRSGEPWWLDHNAPDLLEAQEARFQRDVWADAVIALTEQAPWLTMDQIFDKAIKIETGKRGRAESNRVVAILRSVGWVRKKIKQCGKTFWIYCPENDAEYFTGQNLPSGLFDA